MYVVPTEVVRAAQDPTDDWNKVSFSKIPGLDGYANNWDTIREFLSN